MGGVGINDYSAGWSALHNAVRDVENIQSILFERYNFEEAQILKNADATRESIEEELYAFTHSSVLKEHDSLLIYYSGHGHLDTNNRGFWVPVDAEKGKISKYLPNSRIKEIIADIKCRHVLLISDSCFSGSFFTRGRSNTRGNEAMEEHEKRISRWAFCSGRHNEVVSDGPPNGNSPFASAIINELQIDMTEKLNFVRLADKVTEITRANYPQMPDANPIENAGHGGGQFVFTLKNDEAEEWRLLDKTSVLALEGFVKKYPLSIHISEAQDLVKKRQNGINEYTESEKIDSPNIHRGLKITTVIEWNSDWGFDVGFFLLSTAIGLFVVAIFVYLIMFRILGYPRTDYHDYIYGALILLFAISRAITMGSKENDKDIPFRFTLFTLVGFIIYTIILGIQIFSNN